MTEALVRDLNRVDCAWEAEVLDRTAGLFEFEVDSEDEDEDEDEDDDEDEDEDDVATG